MDSTRATGLTQPVAEAIEEVTSMLHATASQAARWWADQLQAGDKQLFFEKLYDLVSPCSTIRLETDYDPDETLLKALHAANIPCQGFMFSCDGLLPQKTRMVIEDDTIKVRAGYGSNWEAL